MQKKSFADMQCSIARTLDQVGSWWSLLIIRDAMMGARKFKHFETSLGIAKNTLSSRLNQLVESGILQKVQAKEGGGFAEYQLTKKGHELAPVMMALAQWGDQWAVHEDGPTFAFTDAQTGSEISRIWPRRDGGELLPLSDVRLKSLTDLKPKPASKRGQS